MIRVIVSLAALWWLGHAAVLANALQSRANAEMSAMYEADQAARKVEEIDWTKLDAEDGARRKRARTLLDAGELKSGDDYFHAAFIFQHGSEANEFLLAHVLATTA